MSTSKYGIWCEVWGGITGSRCAWLKVDGQVQRYETLEEAEAIATDIQNKRSSNPRASFSYQAREIIS